MLGVLVDRHQHAPGRGATDRCEVFGIAAVLLTDRAECDRDRLLPAVVEGGGTVGEQLQRHPVPVRQMDAKVAVERGRSRSQPDRAVLVAQRHVVAVVDQPVLQAKQGRPVQPQGGVAVRLEVKGPARGGQLLQLAAQGYGGGGRAAGFAVTGRRCTDGRAGRRVRQEAQESAPPARCVEAGQLHQQPGQLLRRGHGRARRKDEPAVLVAGRQPVRSDRALRLPEI